jgi:hypothetical protein
MTMTQSLLDFIMNLLSDSDAKAAFIANPERALADAGLSDVCSEDVSDAMSYVAEYHPQVSYIGPREYNVGNSAIAQHNYDPDEHHGDWHGGEWHGDPHATAIEKLEYISNNYAYTDSHDTVIDKSVNETIWNKGVLDQRFDDHSVTATDHSVAAGRDIDGNVANGDGNVVGDGNSVGNTVYRDDHSINDSFNGNNIADHGGVAGHDNDGNVTNPDHSAVATNGSRLDASTHDSHDQTTVVKDSFNDSHDHTVVKDSGNSYDDSGNTNIHDSGNSYEHSGNTSVHETDIHDNSQHVDQRGLVNANVHDVNALDDIHLLGH